MLLPFQMRNHNKLKHQHMTLLQMMRMSGFTTYHPDKGSNALVATTRARARQEAEAEKESLQKQWSKVRPNPVLPAEGIQPEVWKMGDKLNGSIFIGGRERPLLSRSQKRDGESVTVREYVQNRQQEFRFRCPLRS